MQLAFNRPDDFETLFAILRSDRGNDKMVVVLEEAIA